MCSLLSFFCDIEKNVKLCAGYIYPGLSRSTFPSLHYKNGVYIPQGKKKIHIFHFFFFLSLQMLLLSQVLNSPWFLDSINIITTHIGSSGQKYHFLVHGVFQKKFDTAKIHIWENDFLKLLSKLHSTVLFEVSKHCGVENFSTWIFLMYFQWDFF